MQKKRKGVQRKPNLKFQYKVNRLIRHTTIRLVGDNVEPGVYDIRDAQRKANELSLDLVEISSKADPPVCTIVDFNKFLYEKKKKEKELKAKQVKTVIKEIRFTPNTDDHDFEFKAKHAEKFLQEGSKVKTYVQFKGRNIVFKDRGQIILLRFAQRLEEWGVPEQMPLLEGRRMFLFLTPKKTNKVKKVTPACGTLPGSLSSEPGFIGDRILSVLVPDEFLTWANNEYGSGDRKEYARAIAQVADPGDPKLQQFLKKHDYETSQDSLKGTAAGALQALLGIMAFLGLSFFVLATIIFLMAFELTIARARQEIDLLIQLGHTLPSLTYAVAGTFVPAVLGISTVSIGLLIVVVRLLSSKIVEQGLIIAPGIWWGVWLSAVIFVGATIGLSIWRIWRSLVALAR